MENPSVLDCQECFKEEGKIWSLRHANDLENGICPKVGPSEEIYECEKTGQPILQPPAA